ncbi:hypothetical protein ACWDV4_06770 [Micromonospora sp. NPDC003197]
MLTDQRAIDLALAYIANNHLVDVDVQLAVKPEWVKRLPGAVVVGYNSVEFAGADDPTVSLVGNMPIRVEESSCECRELSMEEYLALYESDKRDILK